MRYLLDIILFRVIGVIPNKQSKRFKKYVRTQQDKNKISMLSFSLKLINQ